MCNDYEQHVIRKLFAETADQLDLGLSRGVGPADWREADDIHPRELGPVLRSAGNGVEVVPMTFGFPSPKGGRPIINLKSDYETNGETKVRDYSQSRRCVIIASAFFEFKGSGSPKAKYRFTLNHAPFIGIAGVCKGETFAMLTTRPGPDIAAIHDRQIVILRPEDYGRWLSFSPGATELIHPLPAGSLTVEQVRPGAQPKPKKAA